MVSDDGLLRREKIHRPANKMIENVLIRHSGLLYRSAERAYDFGLARRVDQDGKWKFVSGRMPPRRPGKNGR
jgi:hypothetical protein